MTKKESEEEETAHSVLAKAFGDKYSVWNNIAPDKIALTAEEKKKLQELIKERDHYEIKRTIAKLKLSKTNINQQTSKKHFKGRT